MRNQSADRGAGRDTVAVLDGYAMGHETAHREAREEHAVHVQLAGFDQRIKQSHQESGVVDIAWHQARIPHGSYPLVQSLWNNNDPFKFIRNLLEMKPIVHIGNVVGPTMQKKQHR